MDVKDLLFIVTRIRQRQLTAIDSDTNEDGMVNILDLIYVVKRMKSANIYKSGIWLTCMRYALLIMLLLASLVTASEDLNNDGTISVVDLLVIVRAIPTQDLSADVNMDGAVNILDMLRVVKRIGETVEAPSAGYFEAESFTLTAPMVKGSDALARGGQYIHPTTGTDSASPVAEATYQVTLEPRTYYLWVRLFGPTEESDALYVGIDSTWDRVYPTLPGNYEWVKVETVHQSGNFAFQLTGTSHTLRIGHGELLARADALFLTSDPNAVPGHASNATVCGNGIPDSGEACDAGTANGACPASCSLSCTVNQCPPTCTLTATPASGSSPVSGTLAWTTANSPISCAASGAWSGTRNVAGGSQAFGPLAASTNFSLSCTNANGTGSCAAMVVVNPSAPVCSNGITEGSEQCDLGSGNGPCPAACSSTCTNNTCLSPPTCTINANPSSGTSPLSGTLTWTTTNNPTSCTASGGWSGSRNVAGGSQAYSSLGVTTTYTLTCSNSAGTNACSRAVTVSQPPSSGGIPGPISTGGTTYYVSPSGSDSNAGSSSSPWRTLQKAANNVNPGDIVIVRDGVYTASSGDYVFQIGRSGTASQWITFRSENQWGAIIDGSNARHSGIRIGNDVSYVRIDMFQIQNAQAGGISANSFNVHHIYYYNNLIHNIGGYCTDSTGGIVGFRDNDDGHHMTYDGNVIHTIGRLTPADGCSYSTNNYRNHDHGLYINAEDLTIINNIFYNNKRGWDIQAADMSNNWVIANNVFADPNPDRAGKIVLWEGNTNILIENNIFYNPNTAAITISDCGKSNVIVRNNIITAGTAVDDEDGCGGVTATNNKLSTDPKFVNPSARDYHLQASSPGVNTGTTIATVTTDYDRVARPQGSAYDIGAFER